VHQVGFITRFYIRIIYVNFVLRELFVNYFLAFTPFAVGLENVSK
jgi:hypothetical protein